MSNQKDRSVLSGTRVIDLTDEKGMYCARLLADMSAEVIHVDPPGIKRPHHCHPERSEGSRGGAEHQDKPPIPRDSSSYLISSGFLRMTSKAGTPEAGEGNKGGESAEQPPNRVSSDDPYIIEANLGKRSITLDIEPARGQELLKRLMGTATVLVESYAPGYLDKLGLGYAPLSEINPRLVIVSITGFGQSGPYRDYKTSDIAAAAMGGQIYVNGDANTPPLKLFGNQSYYLAGLFGANAVLLALLESHNSGKGQHIDISLMECVAATLDHVLVRYFYEEVVAQRQGGLYWNNAFRIFPCHDGYILLSMSQQWDTLVEWLNSEGMAEDLADSKWRDRDERLKHLDHVIDVLEKWTRGHSVAELVEKGQLMHFPWANVASVPELLASPQLAARNYFTEVEGPEGKACAYPGPAVKLSASPWQVGQKAPQVGEDNPSIYRELGLTESEIEKLARDGII